MFIGREAELQFLNERYGTPDAQLIVLYGRRRVGKTETLREFCRGKPHVFYACTQSTDRAQLAGFSRQMLRQGIPASRYISQFPDWESAFRTIPELPFGEHKRLVVLDEFPYMCKGNPGIPSVLQNLWDETLRDNNVMIILCGSSMSFIEKDLLAEKNPLYGRATGIYKMREMGFYDAAQFFPGYSDRDKVMAYAVLGGIPHYLNQFQAGVSLEDNIQRSILTRGSVLYSEVEFLLHQELRETVIYNAIIEVIANGGTRLGEISQKSLVDDTAKTSVYLKNLLDLGIVTREFSVDTGAKAQANQNRGIYRITDHFFRFWYAFVFPNLSMLEDGDVEGVYEEAVRPALHEFASLAFEDVCREYIREQNKRGELPFRCTRLGRWMGRTSVRDAGAPGGIRMAETEIDLLGTSRDRSRFLVGECKFRSSPFRYADYLNTRAKLRSQQEQAEFYYALFSESGFDEKITTEAEGNDHLLLYSLGDICEIQREDSYRARNARTAACPQE